MTEYTLHWWLSGTTGVSFPTLTLPADSRRHGAALALRQFMLQGCDLTVPLAHVDITGPDGVRQTLLVGEVLDWLNEPEQTDFSEREGLRTLRR